MIIIPNKNIDWLKTNKYISNIIGHILLDMSKPCSLISLTEYKKDLLRLTGIDENDIKSFKLKLDKKYSNFQILNDELTLTIVILLLLAIRDRNKDNIKLLYQFLSVRFYSNRIYTHFPKKFCSSELWSLALDQVSAKHLFRSKTGISNAILFISDEELKRNSKIIEKPISMISDREVIEVIIYSLRTRIAQSVRSFAEVYYQLSKKYHDLTPSSEEGEEIKKRNIDTVSEKISMIMCTYGIVDKLALSESIAKSSIRKDIAISIISEISTPERKEEINFIIILIDKLESIKNICIELKRNKILRKIYDDVKISNKYSIKEKMESLLYSLEIKNQLRTIYTPQLISFLSNYITLYLRNRIC